MPQHRAANIPLSLGPTVNLVPITGFGKVRSDGPRALSAPTFSADGPCGTLRADGPHKLATKVSATLVANDASMSCDGTRQILTVTSVTQLPPFPPVTLQTKLQPIFGSNSCDETIVIFPVSHVRKLPALS